MFDILISHLDIELAYFCMFDWLGITDGIYTAKLCGTMEKYSMNGTPFCIQTYSSSLSLNFHSDSTVKGTGFGLSYFIRGESNEVNHTCSQYNIYNISQLAQETTTPPSTGNYSI